MEFLDKGDSSPLIDFYKNKTVFITGATGFVGTALVEKILYACKDVKKIFVLIKPSSKKSVEEKMQQWFDSSAFERLKVNDPEAITKIIPIKGDIMSENVGILNDDIRTIQEEVDIMFHLAANINFNMTLAEAITINAKASMEIMKICKGIKHLEAFVYVSTAYCNTNKKIVFEKVYNTIVPMKEVNYFINNCSNNYSLKQLLDGRPNTYVYSKALSEEVFAKEIINMPIAIVRPSIIISAIRDPCPGWLKGQSGISFGTTLLGKNILRCVNGGHNLVIDLIPVDSTVNLIMASAWDISNEWKMNKREVKVFNFCSGLQNAITFGKFADICKKHFARNSWLPYCLPPLIIKNRYLYLILLFFIQTIPDGLLMVVDWLTAGMFSSIHSLIVNEKHWNVIRYLEFFISNEFTFIDYNVNELYSKMEEKDKEIFDFNITNVHWNDFLKLYTEGLEKYVLSK